MWRLTLLCCFVSLGCGGVRDTREVDAGPEPDAEPDPCSTNICECEEDADCGDFEICDTTSTPGRLCECAPTYERQGEDCVFAGALVNPGFQETDGWTRSNDVRVTIDPDAAGALDTGVATLNGDGVCLFDSLSQTVTMPPRDRAEIFAVDVSYLTEDPGAPFLFDEPGPVVTVNGGWHAFPQENPNFATHSFCLGEGGYGGDVEFEVSAAQESKSCDGNPSVVLHLDRLAVRPAAPGECPAAVGETINADAEADEGWAFDSASDGTAGFVAGAGNGGSRGLRLTRSTNFSRASATSKISLPLDATTPTPAIEFFTAGTASAVFEVQLGGQAVSRLTPSGMRRVCIPDWAKGTVQDITFALTQELDSGASSPQPETVDIDDIAVVSDAGCGDSSNDYDNGFETSFNGPGLSPGWSVTLGGVNGVMAPADIVNDPTLARSGNGSVRLRVSNPCHNDERSSFARRDVIVPPADGNAGPAFKGFVNVPNSPTGRGGLRLRRGRNRFDNVEVDALEGVGYNEVILCIPRKFIGRRVTLDAYNTGGGGGCSEVPQETVFADDLEITTDPSCTP
jgi:hypothetical protein